jgi:hypothetical protein
MTIAHSEEESTSCLTSKNSCDKGLLVAIRW